MPIDRRITAVASICAGAVFAATAVLAAPATLDATFGGDGRVTTDLTGGFDGASSIAIQADGKIVVVGAAGGSGGRFALARYETDGTLDETFGGDGKVTTSFTAGWDRAAGVAIQANGKIVAAGSANASCSCSTFALARYETDGTLDETFGGDGKVTTSFRSGALGEAVAIQPDGKVVVVGGQTPEGSRFRVARYNTDGALDTGFSDDGKVRTKMGDGEGSAISVAIQSSGKVLVAGYTDVPHEFGDPFRPKFALARYLQDGRLDPLFSGDGRVTTGSRAGLIAEGVAIQTDGRIVAAGHTFFGDGRFAVARYGRRGVLDGTFGGDGKVTTNFTPGEDAAFGVAVQADGKIVAAGHAAGRGGRFALARYLGG